MSRKRPAMSAAALRYTGIFWDIIIDVITL
jgi:hypothetical protein